MQRIERLENDPGQSDIQDFEGSTVILNQPVLPMMVLKMTSNSGQL